MLSPGALLQSCGAAYAAAVASHPVPVKSATAAVLFAGADCAAQAIAGDGRFSQRRVAGSTAVGLFVFGPSSHLWFHWVLRWVPGNGLPSLLAKTALGQVFFGPYITVVFFSAALWSTGSLSLTSLRAKVKADLWPTMLAGLGFWPLMDFIAFALLSEHLIPPFLNVCSFVWTIFLSLQAARSRPAKLSADAAWGQ